MTREKKTPRVSVVISAYNVSGCIRESVESVLGQTLEDFELIICDDCSSDGTYQVLAELASQDKRIRLLRNEVNSGQALGRNRCIALSRGEYVAVQDGDDRSGPTRLETQAAFLDDHPEYAFVASHADNIGDDGVIRDRPNPKSGEVEKGDFLWGLPFLHPTVMFRKASLAAVGGYLVNKETRYRNEDYDMLMRMYARGMRGYVYPRRLYVYYEGPAALKRRKYRYRLDEARVRYRNFKALGLMPAGLFYAVKPLVVGLFPQRALNVVRAARYRFRQS